MTQYFWQYSICVWVSKWVSECPSSAFSQAYISQLEQKEEKQNFPYDCMYNFSVSFYFHSYLGLGEFMSYTQATA